MSKIKTNPVDLSVSLERFRISPFDWKFRGNIRFSPSTRSFCVLQSLDKYKIDVLFRLPRGCMWSNCVREGITCSRCDYNIAIL